MPFLCHEDRMINMRINIALNLLFLKYASCFLNDEQYESSQTESNIKGMAKLPCNKIHFSEDDGKLRTPTLVIWFKYGIASPVYSVDFRQVKEGSHWSSNHVFGSRAFFNVDESVLVIERVMEADSGQYKCRIDFEKSPTKNYVVNLSVIGGTGNGEYENEKKCIPSSTNQARKNNLSDHFYRILGVSESEEFDNDNEMESCLSQKIRRNKNQSESLSVGHAGNNLLSDDLRRTLGGADSENFENDEYDVKFSPFRKVRQSENKYNSSSTSRARNDSSDDFDRTLVGKETNDNVRNDVKSSTTSQFRRDDYEFESSPTSYPRNNSSDDPYCLLWIESPETKIHSSPSNEEIPFMLLKPSSNCTFCDELHWSHLCMKISTYEERLRYYRAHNICYICGMTHRFRFDCSNTRRFCKWPHCRAINLHHSALCPNAPYPVTAEVVQAYERRINDLNRIHKRANRAWDW